MTAYKFVIDPARFIEIPNISFYIDDHLVLYLAHNFEVMPQCYDRATT